MTKPLSDDELLEITQQLDDLEGLAPAIATDEHGQRGFINMRRLLVTIAADRAKLEAVRGLLEQDSEGDPLVAMGLLQRVYTIITEAGDAD